MATPADITLWRDETGWCFRPHSGKADDFLFAQFGLIGERDLTAADVDLICRRAERRGLRVDDKTREG
jgi:hypothetical protein